MPIYEFQCAACGNGFEELFRSASEERRVDCPECGSRRCEKQWSTFGITVGGASASCSSGGSCSNCSGECCGNCGH